MFDLSLVADTDRRRATRALGLALVASLLAGITTAFLSSAFTGVAARSAETAPYVWWVRADAPPDSGLVVMPHEDDWATYIDASNSRLDQWIAQPDTAPDLSGTFVSLTFVGPITVPLLYDVIAPLKGTVMHATAVGLDEDGNLVEEASFGAPDADDVGNVRYDAGALYSFTLEGVATCLVQLGERVGTAPVVDVRALDNVRDHEHVRFFDTTPIQVQQVDWPSTMPGSTTQLGYVLVDSPWHQLDW